MIQRSTLMVLTTMMLIIGGVDGVGQTKREPTVYLIDNTPFDFGDFYNPFLETIKNLQLGNRLRINQDWDGVWNDKFYSPRDGDVWISISASLFQGGGGYYYSMVYGHIDDCRKSVYNGNKYGYVSAGGNDMTYALRSNGYEFGNEVVQHINQRLRK